MYQKDPPVLTSTTTPITLTEGFRCFLTLFRRDYHLQIIGLFLSGFLFMRINVSVFPLAELPFNYHLERIHTQNYGCVFILS